VFFGRYTRIDGSRVQGTSIADLIKARDPALHKKAVDAFAATESALKRMVDSAEDTKAPMKFDQMIAEGNAAGAAIIKAAIQALVAQTRALEEVARALGIEHLSPDAADHAL
jgi:putative iron-regulated protein